MNIFFLHMIPSICAQMHCDKHMKMIIEYAQMLSTAHRILDGKLEIKVTKNGRKMKTYTHENEMFYKSTHINHPCTVWVRQSRLNYMWLYELFCCLCEEYTRRYKKIHLTEKKLKVLLKTLPNNLKGNTFTKFPQAMPEECKHESVIHAYRTFYKTKPFTTKLS